MCISNNCRVTMSYWLYPDISHLFSSLFTCLFFPRGIFGFAIIITSKMSYSPNVDRKRIKMCKMLSQHWKWILRNILDFEINQELGSPIIMSIIKSKIMSFIYSVLIYLLFIFIFIIIIFWWFNTWPIVIFLFIFYYPFTLKITTQRQG